MSEEIKVGDVVRLRSGGPWMAVVFAGKTMTTDIVVECVWSDGKKDERGTYPPAALEKKKRD